MATKGTLAVTAATIIRAEASLIAEHGWRTNPLGMNDKAFGALGLNLSLAACWAVKGEPCQPRDLTPQEAEHVAEVLDIIEEKFSMSITEYERAHAESTSTYVAWSLGTVAHSLEEEIAA